MGQRGQKEILPEGGIDQNVLIPMKVRPLKRGRRGEGGEGGGGRREGGRGGWGRGGRRKFYLRVELIKCIDPNEGEALGRGGREGGRGRGGWKGGKSYLGGGIDQMY